jgi:hypothetical protein
MSKLYDAFKENQASLVPPRSASYAPQYFSLTICSCLEQHVCLTQRGDTAVSLRMRDCVNTHS